MKRALSSSGGGTSTMIGVGAGSVVRKLRRGASGEVPFRWPLLAAVVLLGLWICLYHSDRYEKWGFKEDLTSDFEGYERLWKTRDFSNVSREDWTERRKYFYGGKEMVFHPKLLKAKKVAVTSLSVTSRDSKRVVKNLKRLCSTLGEDSEWALLIVQHEPWGSDKENRKALRVKNSDFGGNCVYLSTQEQTSLPYHLANPLRPNGSKKKCRGRNVGYLYAIHHGAEVISDIDETQSHLDDSLPLPRTIRAREMMDFNPFLKPPVNRAAVVNPYRYFGLSSLRPRGFPLGRTETVDYTWQPWSFGEEHSPIPDGVEVTIPIQQGLYLKHPDATISSSESNFQDQNYFARPLPWQPPIAIDKGSFTPLLGRNSFFHYEAFWGLFTNFLPTTYFVQELRSDVVRGYWVQRLLWDLGKNLGFFTTSITRDVGLYRDLSRAYRGETDHPHAAHLLTQFLDDWTWDQTGSFFDRMERLHTDLANAGFIDPAEVTCLLDWMNDLVEMEYPVPQIKSTNQLWDRSRTFKRPRRFSSLPIDTKKRGSKKDFVYLTQTESDVPKMLSSLPQDTELILLYWKTPATNSTRPGLFYPNTTWTEGRNRLFQEALELEKAQGARFQYMYFVDDDFNIHCKDANISAKATIACYKYVNKMHQKWQPAVGDCDHPGPEVANYTSSIDADATWLDAFWNSMHREVVDMLLPYNRTYDHVAWPGSQGYLRYQVHTFWPRHVYTFTKFHCSNQDHRDYRGAGDITMWGDIGEWLGSLLPEYFKGRLVDWSGTYNSQGTPFEPSMKTRAYDDVCSTTDETQQSYCWTEGEPSHDNGDDE